MNNTRNFWLFSMLVGTCAMLGGCADAEPEEEEAQTSAAAQKKGGNNNNKPGPRTITPNIDVKGRDVTVRLQVSERDSCTNYRVRYTVTRENGEVWISDAKDEVNPDNCRPARFTWKHPAAFEPTSRVCIKVHNNQGLMEQVTACTYPLP